MRPTGSTDPVFTLPACTHTIAPSLKAGRDSAHILPWSSTGTRITRRRPKPSSPSALLTDGCVSSLITTVKGGAPKSPSASTSHPSLASAVVRAAARQVRLAMVSPLTNAAPQSSGRSSSCTSQRWLTSSSREAIGLVANSAAFWSHAPCQPVGRQPRRQAAAVHESKKAPAGAGHGSRRSDPVQEIEHSFGSGRTLGKRLVQSGQLIQGLLRRCHRASVQAPQVSVSLQGHLG